MTFVKVKLGLSKISPGDILDVLLSEEEPLVNVPKAAKEQGHRILEIKNEGSHYRILIEKNN